MSASLVGSEMCIRDSLRALSGPPPDGHRAIGESALTRQLGAPLRGARSACLLYTSDAADDM
eukprot:13503812-Alexandrium_andersonii.AAC.1